MLPRGHNLARILNGSESELAPRYSFDRTTASGFYSFMRKYQYLLLFSLDRLQVANWQEFISILS